MSVQRHGGSGHRGARHGGTQGAGAGQNERQDQTNAHRLDRFRITTQFTAGTRNKAENKAENKARMMTKTKTTTTTAATRIAPRSATTPVPAPAPASAPAPGANTQPKLVYSAEVAKARRDGKPVVALESTLISHGLPHPNNIDVARDAQDAVRAAGAVPATIAVIDGKAHVGLDDDTVRRLATADKVAKLSRSNLAAALCGIPSAPGLGATTVSATMILAHLAGIRIFATGGIGGVHRGGHASMDVSADLFELAHTPVAVVCSGPKAILDLARTREVLESLGVTVVGYGSDDMPAFWARSSGLAVDARADTPGQAADIIAGRAGLGMGGAVLVCNPVDRKLEIDLDLVEAWIAECIDDAPAGAEATPWLLTQIALMSDSRSLQANMRLIVDNAGLAGRIAVRM